MKQLTTRHILTYFCEHEARSVERKLTFDASSDMTPSEIMATKLKELKEEGIRVTGVRSLDRIDRVYGEPPNYERFRPRKIPKEVGTI